MGANRCAGRTWVYADARGAYDEKTALAEERRPILRVSGDIVEVLRHSDDTFMRMHVSKRDPHLMIMEGEMGEFYTLKPAAEKVLASAPILPFTFRIWLQHEPC